MLSLACATIPGYMPGEVHRFLCQRLHEFVLAAERGESPSLILNVPPRHGKSVLVSQCLPQWYLGTYKNREFIFCTYNQDYADEWGRKVKNAMISPLHMEVFGVGPRGDSQAANRMDMANGSSYRAVGIGSSVTGRGAHILSIDDPHKNRAEADSELQRDAVWNSYEADLKTRVAPGGGILVTQTRWHEDDLTGRLLERSNRKWEVITLPALAEDEESFPLIGGGTFSRHKGDALHPERWTRAIMEEIRADNSAREWLALYQQRPTSDAGGYIQASWLRTYSTPVPATGPTSIAVDMAVRTKEENDRTCIAAFGESSSGDLVFLPGIILDRIDAAAAVEAIIDLAVRYKAQRLAIGRDAIAGAIGPFLNKRMQERVRDGTGIWLTIEEIPERTDKQARARTFQARTKGQKVLWPSGALWDMEIKPELTKFPAGKHDDVVDMAAHACALLDSQTPASIIKPKDNAADLERYAEELRRRKEILARGPVTKTGGHGSLFGR